MEEKIDTMDERIISFLHSHTCLTIAVSGTDIPYCATCFYAYSKEETLLIIKSKAETHHVKVALKNKNVAGTILPDLLTKARIRGIQFTGIFFSPQDELLTNVKNVYYSKYPFAKIVNGEIWTIKLQAIKFTDNKLGFGKRIEWKTPEYEF